MTNNEVDKEDGCGNMEDMIQAGTEGIKVKKRDGSEEYFDAEKINRVLNWATEGITGVNASDVAVKANLSLTNGISTDDIHQTLVDTAGDMISEHSPNYTKVAARLYIYMLRKKVWGGKNPPKLYDLIKENIDRGFYDTALLEKYTRQEIDKIDEFIDHDRDDYFDYGGLVQLTEKYLIQNRKTKEIYETPQFQIALIGMIVFQNEPPEERIKWIKKCYDKVSRFCLNLPTPILSGARSKTRSYSSCCLIDVDDTKQSLFAANTTAGMVTCDRYGVGLNLGKLRNINAPIKNGDTLHSGVISWLKMYQDTIHACQQGGARRGAGTVTFPIFHPEIMTILELKNNQGTHENRVPHLDYSIGMSNLFYDRLKQNKDITLFSHHEAPELYDSFGTPEFDKNYLEFEGNNPNSIRISARELYAKFFTERLETARYYCINVDQANSYSPWVDTVQMSNLCVTGDQRVVSNYGLLTAKELYEIGEPLELFDNNKKVNSTPMQLIESGANVYKITLDNGLTHTITDYHKVLVRTSKTFDKKVITENIQCKDLKIGDLVATQTTKGIFGNTDMPDEAFLLGLYQADGTQHKDTIHICIWQNDFDILEEVQNKFDSIYHKYDGDKFINFSKMKTVTRPKFRKCDTGFSTVKKMSLSSPFLKRALGFEKGYIPQWIWTSNEVTQWQYIRGLYYADGTVNVTNGKGNPFYLSITNTNKSFLEELQILLLNLGITSALSLFSSEGDKVLPDGKGGSASYYCKNAYRLVCGSKNDGIEFEKNTKFLSRKKIVLDQESYRDNTKKFRKIKSIEYVGKEDVFCVKVDTDDHHWICNGVITHNCQEVLHPLISESYTGDPEAEIGVCILAAINPLKIKNDHEHQQTCELAVRMLDNIIDIQEYTVKACENFAKNKRSLGIGITNFSGWLASKGLNHNSPETPQVASDFMEKQQYYLMEASKNLAKERGMANHFNRSKYFNGEKSPLDLYNKNLDDLIDASKMDWSSLMEEIKLHGMRNMTMSCQMPCESCLKWDTLIKTSDGYINFRDILEMNGYDYNEIETNNIIGWYELGCPISVITKDGSKIVDKIYYNGYKTTYNIEMENGEVIKCTGNHKFLTVNGWVKASELTEDDDIMEY